MTESEWLSCADPQAMLSFLADFGVNQVTRRAIQRVQCATTRKLRLFACAVCRQVWDRESPGARRAVEVAERYADGEVRELLTSGDIVSHRDAGMAARLMAEWANGIAVSPSHSHNPTNRAMPSAQADLLREVFGNPFRPVRLASVRWGSHEGGNALSLALAAYEQRLPAGHLDAARLAVLADALEEAGCPDGELLRHLRSEERCVKCVACGTPPGPDNDGYGTCDCSVNRCRTGWTYLRGSHVRGCWALDLILGKE